MRFAPLIVISLPLLLAGRGEGGTQLLEDELSVPLEALENRPELRRRVLENPHAYFRWINRSFSRAVCQDFRGRLDAMPIVNLHGDAHLEQFAVTRHYAGLLDFDDTSLGPAVIDLVRFGVSLSLAARERGWTDQEENLLTTFLDAYRLGMRDSETPAPVPPHVRRLRARFENDRPRFLESVVALMQPMDPTEAAGFQRRFLRYAEAILRSRPDVEASFFGTKARGRVRSGIGSAADKKWLVRVEGATDADGDDVILEMKALRDLSGVKCVVAKLGDASRVIVGHSRLTTHRDPFLAIVPRAPDEEAAEAYWVQSWNEHYHELDVRSSLASVEELDEVVHAIGVQLGRGHVNVPSDVDRTALVQAQERALAVDEAAIRVAILELSDRIGVIWEELMRAEEPARRSE